MDLLYGAKHWGYRGEQEKATALMKFTTQGGKQRDQGMAQMTTDKAKYYEAGDKMLGGRRGAGVQGEGL